MRRLECNAIRSCTGIEGMDDVARHLAGRDDDDVEADFAVGVIGMAGAPQFGGADDPAFIPFRHRFHRIVGALARLDLDEDHDAAAAGDDVDFSEWRFQRRARMR
jgi:hypothetical protein